jgi:hypothetical protein
MVALRVVWAKDRTNASLGCVTVMTTRAKRADIGNIESVSWKSRRKEVIARDGSDFEIERSGFRNSWVSFILNPEKKQRRP